MQLEVAEAGFLREVTPLAWHLSEGYKRQVSPQSVWYVATDAVADAVNPFLAIVALVMLVLRARRSWREAALYGAATAVGLAGIYAVAAADRQFALWPRIGGDYSLHTAFAVSIGASMMLWTRRGRASLALFVAAYLVVIAVMNYHTVRDIIAAAAIAVTVTLPGHLFARWIVERPSRASTEEVAPRTASRR